VKKRHLAREIALQVLYMMDVAREDRGRLLSATRDRFKIDPDTWAYTARLVDAVSGRLAELDGIIAKQCQNWDLERVAVLDKNILRMAITEILYFEDIPAKVAIDEAIELAKKFSTEKSGTFVNGILDPIAFKTQPAPAPASGANHGIQ
jgi:N utilization substance protein B